MASTQPHPFRGFLDMMSEMERMRRLGKTGYDVDDERQPRTPGNAWVPTTDIVARGPDLVISVELAGVSLGDIDISVADGVLMISGERPAGEEGPDETAYVRERHFGAFRRSMVLPEGVQEDRISATGEAGLLRVVVPGAAALPTPAPRRIPIAQSGRADR